MRLLVLALAALALAGCESTQEKSAKLEKVAKREAAQAAKRAAPTQRPLTITRASAVVKVLTTSVLHSSEGAVAVVTVRNLSASALRDVPIEITVIDARGASVYTNATPGLARSLTSLPLLSAHASGVWVDDQVQASATPASVSAKLGEGERVGSAPAAISVQGAHLSEGEVEGTLVNHSAESQREAVVDAVLRRTGRIVAAGRAVVPIAEAHSSTRFQAFLIGDAQGGQLEVSATCAPA